MDWMITYRTAEGLIKKVAAHALKLPDYRGLAERVVRDAYEDRPPLPLGNLSAVGWLDHCKLEILDIDTLKAAQRA